MPEGDAETFVADVPLGDLFEAAVKAGGSPKALANWIINNLRAKLTESETSLNDLKIKPTHFSELVGLVDSGKISSKIAQEVFNAMFESGTAPARIVDEKGLSQMSDTGALEAICDQVIQENPKSADDFRGGKEAALNFLKGQVMKLTRGKANPGMVGDLLAKKLQG